MIANSLHYASDHLPVYATFNFNTSFVELTSFTALIEGFYNGSTMIPDTVIIELRNATFPYALVDQAKILLNDSGQGTGKFNTALNGVPYYLVLKHRNALETWSATTQTFTSSVLNYDFTSSSNKAYGNNLKLINGKWCIYGGDVNQDGFVETADLSLVFSDNVNGVTGYISTDVNGDLIIGVEDVSKVFEKIIFLEDSASCLRIFRSMINKKKFDIKMFDQRKIYIKLFTRINYMIYFFDYGLIYNSIYKYKY